MKKILIALTLALAVILPANAQTTPPQGGLGGSLTSIFGLYDPKADYLTNAIDFVLATGLNYKSDLQGVSQDVTLSVWRKIGNAGKLGVEGGIDTLGEGGTAIDAAHVHLGWKFVKHNIGASVLVGHYRDIANNKQSFEVGGGLEAYLSENAGTFLKYYVGGLAGRDKTYGRIVAGVTVKF